ncbi:MAG TPA: tetratricopeptide repeat protein [bacterium]|nr:tetratricopeptide repeat protein [bacterium]
MKWKVLFIFSSIIISCAPTRYKPAERYVVRKEYNLAIREYLRLLDPHIRDGKRYIYYDREAITGIGIVYWQMKRYETAARILRTVVEKDPQYGKAQFYLGLSYEGMERNDEAIKVYKQYIYIPVNDPYKNVLFGRLNWLVQNQISREIQLALQNEQALRIEDYPEKSVGVLYFLSLSDDPQWEPLKKGIAEMIITDLAKVKELKVVERLRLNYIMEELNLSQTGLMDEEQIPRMGKLMGARNIIKGSYMVMPSLRMTLDAGIYESDNVFLPTTTSFEGNLVRLFQMEKELVLRILDYMNIVMTPQLREQILIIPTENMTAFMAYCRGLDEMDRGNFQKSQEYFREALRIDPNFKEAADKLASPRVWAATQSSSLVRVDREISQYMKTVPRGRPTAYYVTPDLVSTWNRLQMMGIRQDAGFIPGYESRKSFHDADLNSVLLPAILPAPPTPNK